MESRRPLAESGNTSRKIWLRVPTRRSRCLRSRATTSCRSSSPRAQRPSRAGVVISHGNILANLEPLEREIGNYLKYERSFHPLRFLNLLPLSHVFGQFLGIFLPQLLAATVIFQDMLNPSEVMQIIKKERVSVVVAVPRLMQSLKDKIERDFEAEGKLEWFRRQLATAKNQHFVRRWWRFRRIHNRFGWKFWAFISGGAALDAETEEFWGRLSFVVIQGYGLTETTSLISLTIPSVPASARSAKCSKAARSSSTRTAKSWCAAQTSLPVIGKEKQLKPVLNEEGWFRTGDLGELDAEGNLYFKGRKKNVIVTREGMNVYPEDLEAALRQQPGTRDCVVVGLEQGGNAEPCAVLILRDSSIQSQWSGVPISNSRSISRCAAGLCGPSRISRALRRRSRRPPRSRRRCSDTSLQVATEAVVAQGALADLIARVTGRSTGPLTPDAKLDGDLNLNSMDRVELMSALEDRYQVDLNEANFTSVNTVGDLERLLHEPQKSAAKRLPISAMGAALANHVDSQLHLLSAHLAGDHDHGAPDDHRPREPARHRWAVSHQLQSCYLHRCRLRAASRFRRACATSSRSACGERCCGRCGGRRKLELV